MVSYRSIRKIVLSFALVAAFGALMVGGLMADEKPAAPAAAPAAAVPAPAAPAAGGEVVIFSDDFNTDGKLGEWGDVQGVTENDVKGGYALLQCAAKESGEKKEADAEEEGETEYQMAHLNYDAGETSGGIGVEVKYDEFKPGNGGSFRFDLINTSSGDAVVLGCWPSGNAPGVIVFNAGTKVQKNLSYTNPSGLLKAVYTDSTKTLQAFYKETADAAYKELPGSPCVLEGFEGGPYRVSVNVCAASTGTTSVKLDSVKITSPK